MIGVIAPGSDPNVVSEFFELFKTPWEHFRPSRQYDVILCAGEVETGGHAAKLVVHYADRPLPIDEELGRTAIESATPEILSRNGRSVVVYGRHLVFQGDASEEHFGGGKRCSYRCEREGIFLNRVGYDLFAQIAELLTNGQPGEFAQFPAVEMHIALLREMIVESGVELLEIPPVPQGYGCIACLTHDIDHPAIKNHRWDSTAFGFLFRATAGSVVQFLRGRITFRSMLRNWAAALKLPLVYVGLARDFWSGFEERYFSCDRALPSTYFVIPFRGYAGKAELGVAPKRRAAGYSAAEIRDALKKITAKGCEVGLHGIDAWLDQDSGLRELHEVKQCTGSSELGVRMHWLFWGKESPRVLEQAGALYDSTIGYRETVGFRSGTTQAYKPLATEMLLELPLHVMDTALFYRAYLGHSQHQAESHVREIVETVAEYGGCLTINWHDRSLAPERNWDRCYRALLDDLEAKGAWFATARDAASWFRMRRSVTFESVETTPKEAPARFHGNPGGKLPGMKLRIHGSKQRPRFAGGETRAYVELPVELGVERREAVNS